MINRRYALDVSNRSIRLARTEQLPLLAAGVAFYAFFSVVPLALLVIALTATVGGEALEGYVRVALSDLLTPSAQQLLAEALVDDAGRWSATVVGILGLLWGASRVFLGLGGAFSVVYGTTTAKSLVDSLWDLLLVSLAIGASLSVVAVVELLVLFASTPASGLAIVGYGFALLGLFAAFLPMYVIFPGVDVGVREAVPGTAVAAVGWFLLGHGFTVYTSLAGVSVVYGALGAVFLVLVWLYVAAALVVSGAVLNAVLADRDTDRQLQSPGARHIPTEAMTDDDSVAEEDTAKDATETASGPSSDVSADHARDRTRDRADDPAVLYEEIERLRDRLESFEDDVESRTVSRDALKSDLKRYVRRRARRTHARGWGPYLVLLYGTIMTIAAFHFLSGGWAILAMFVVWTSTIGVYILMVLFGAGLSLLGAPGRLRDRVGEWRS